MNSEIMDIFISAMMIAIAQTNHMAFFLLCILIYIRSKI